jgi:pimeloyl-ACP methyl ester carboxylesterase
MSTANTVRDMDILRQLVTPDLPLNFLGWSYGTTLAMEYIRTFPANAGRMVLDSVTAPDVDAYADDLTSTSAIYDAYLRLFERCAEDRECPGRTVDEVQQVIFAARDAAEAGTLYGSYGTQAAPTGFDGYTLGSAYLIHHGIFALTYSASERAYLDFKMGMQELEAGYMTTFEWYGLNLDGYSPDEGTRNNSYEILTVVNCLDVDTRDMHTEAEFRAQQEALEEADPFTAAFFENANGYEEPFEPNAGCFWTEEALEDDLIPDPPAKIAAPVNTSGKSFLVIGSKGDTVTPYEYAVKLAEQIDSTLLTYTGEGHAISYGYSSKCIDDAVDDYLIEGTLPELNAECDPDGY